jgi:hypothetical protein
MVIMVPAWADNLYDAEIVDRIYIEFTGFLP